MGIRRIPFVIVLGYFGALAAFANGTHYTWTGKAGNQDWLNVTNWSPSTSLPNPGDTATIAPVNSSGFIVDLNSAVTLDVPDQFHRRWFLLAAPPLSPLVPQRFYRVLNP